MQDISLKRKVLRSDLKASELGTVKEITNNEFREGKGCLIIFTVSENSTPRGSLDTVLCLFLDNNYL